MGVYNGERYLDVALESILSQTFVDFEFIIINDASTDKSAEILAGYDDPRLRIFKNEQNMGLARSLNRAIELAQGTYIARQDADDLSEPRRLEKQVAFLDTHLKVGVVGTTTEWIDDEDKFIKIWHQPLENAAIQETLLDYCCLIHGSTMYRSETIAELGGYDSAMRTGQDYDLWLRLSETWDLACLPDVLYKYRHHTNMASLKRGGEQKSHAQTGLTRAVQRRISYTKLAFGLGRQQVPARLRQKNRQWFAERYVWWSASARYVKRSTALRFLGAAFLFNPVCPPLWDYLKGIVSRKFNKLTGLNPGQKVTLPSGDSS